MSATMALDEQLNERAEQRAERRAEALQLGACTTRGTGCARDELPDALIEPVRQHDPQQEAHLRALTGRHAPLPPLHSVHEDTEPDGDVDASDLWYYTAFDERWRALATFRSSDSSPKEEFVPHQAGLDGLGGSSYIDLVITRDKDANTAWTSASDGTLEERGYYAQNWRADVVALIGSDHLQWEQDRYSAYGVPFGLPGGDCDSDGDCDSTDVTQVQSWIDASAYDVRGDVDLDGDVDAGDKSTVQSSHEGTNLGRLALSAKGNNRSTSGLPYFPTTAQIHVRQREFDAPRGRWLSRDRSNYVEGANLYMFVRGMPINRSDASGGLSLCHACGSGDGGAGVGTPDVLYSRAPSSPLLDEEGWKTAKGKCCLDAFNSGAPWQGDSGYDIGGVVCCNGKPVACNWFYLPDDNGGDNDELEKLIEKCITKHELQHIDDLPDDICKGVADSVRVFFPQDTIEQQKAGLESEITAHNIDQKCFDGLSDRKLMGLSVSGGLEVAPSSSQPQTLSTNIEGLSGKQVVHQLEQASKNKEAIYKTKLDNL